MDGTKKIEARKTHAVTETEEKIYAQRNSSKETDQSIDLFMFLTQKY